MRARWLLGLWLASAAVLGCSLLVDPLVDEPRCGGEATAVCPRGLTCQEGRCKPVCLDREICDDGIDNDCNGQIDEPDIHGREICGDGLDNDCDGRVDEGSDVDGDGFTWCGLVQGERRGVDCDDERYEVKPTAQEICDGLDNDCDGTIDVAPTGQPPLCAADERCASGRCAKLNCASGDPRFACPPGQVCLNATCVPLSVNCGTISCAQGEICEDGVCRLPPKRSNGSPCMVDDECLSGTCIDAAALRLPGNGGVCGEACCSDASCAHRPGEQCYAPGTGARSCLPTAMFPRGEARQCTNNQSCGDSQVCALSNDQSLSEPFTPWTSLTTSVCRAPIPNGRTLAQYCNQVSSVCSSRICVRGVLQARICTQPCGHSGECRRFAALAPFSTSETNAYCRYVPVRWEEGTSRALDYTPACVIAREEETGDGEWGDECASAQDCKDRGCVGASEGEKGRCLITCCENALCATESGKRGTCRPFKVGMVYEMRCSLPPLPP